MVETVPERKTVGGLSYRMTNHRRGGDPSIQHGRNRSSLNCANADGPVS